MSDVSLTLLEISLPMKLDDVIDRLRSRIKSRAATVGVCGMGYVGLPLAVTAAKAGFELIGFDVDANKIKALNQGTSYIDAVSSVDIKSAQRNWKIPCLE